MYRARRRGRYNRFEAGPSRRTPSLDSGQMVELQEINVDDDDDDDNTSYEVQESMLETTAVLKPRPLSLAVDYEIVGGVPAFVWGPSPGCYPTVSRYAISSDGSRIAIVEGWQRICVYNMLENFSLVAEWEDTSRQNVDTFTFHNNRNTELVVVFDDSTVALMGISIKPKESMEESNLKQSQIGTMEIRKESPNEGCETWVIAREWIVENIITLLFIKQDEFRKLQIKSNEDINPTFSYCSITQKALMLVRIGGDNYKPLDTKIYNDIDLTKEVLDCSPITIEDGQSFGFSVCGRYFLIWRYIEGGEDAIEMYEIQSLKRSMDPIAKKLIGHGVMIVQGHFVKSNRAAIEVLKEEVHNTPIVAFMVARANQLAVMLWEPMTNEIIKEFDVTTKEMQLSNPIHIEFCISPNVRWLAVGCSAKGTFNLFSMMTGIQVWTLKLNTVSRLLHTFNSVKFDKTSQRLIINACDPLYILCPPCLIEDHQLNFESVTYDLVRECGESMRTLKSNHQKLIPKHILKQMLVLKYKEENLFIQWFLDVVSSRIKPTCSFLFQTDVWLMVIEESLDIMHTRIFTNNITSQNTFDEALEGLSWLVIDESEINDPKALHETKLVWIFVHENEDKDITVVFWSQSGLYSLFIDFGQETQQDRIQFIDEEPFVLRQSEDGHKVSCLHDFGVIIINLKEKTTTHNVQYKVNLAHWLQPYIKTMKESFLDVTNNGNSIAIGWDKKNEKLLAITSMTEEKECKILLGDESTIVPCWTLQEDFTTIAFLEFTKDNQTISSICIYDIEEGKSLKRIDQALWNPHMKRVLDSIDMQDSHEYILQFDEHNGHLWIIVLHKGGNVNHLVLIPLNPYSFIDCNPCLYMLDYQVQENIELEELALKFGHSLSTMPFNGKINFQVALENKDKPLIRELILLAKTHGISSCALLLQGFGKEVFKDLSNNLVQDRNEFGLVFLLDLIEEGIIPFKDSALMMEKGFQELWFKYLALIEPRLIRNSLAKKTCKIEVPIRILTKETNILNRMGTSNSIPIEWEEANDLSNATSYWRSLHEDHLRESEQMKSDATIIAIVTFFTIANVCKVGLNGILRFLLMQEAPSHIFKAPLIKWVIEFKWHKVWKMRSLKSFTFYLVFMVLYSIYSIWIAFIRNGFGQDIPTSVCLTILLIILMIFVSILLYLEYVQMSTYIKDGEKLFPNDHRWGLRKYRSSLWNIVEVLTYIMIILVIPILHLLNLLGVNAMSILYACIALESILIWIKVWYFAQAFKKTGAFVLMMENIIKDCAPFLSLALVILFGFSFAMFVLFQQALHEKLSDYNEDNDKDTKDMIEQSFGDPWKTMVTLFYAMIGTFEPKAYYASGSLSILITILFVLYLAIQMIVMVNMLIAIMGDTFDRVKSTEEEQLLMGRARFIDACEAQLSEKDIEAIEASIGKYFYVLFPKDEDVTDDIRLWQGRVKTIEDRVSKMIKDSENKVMKKIDKNNEEIKKDLIELKAMEENILQMRKDMEQIKENIDEILTTTAETNRFEKTSKDIEKIKQDIYELKQMKGDMEEIKEVLFLLKDRS